MTSGLRLFYVFQRSAQGHPVEMDGKVDLPLNQIDLQENNIQSANCASRLSTSGKASVDTKSLFLFTIKKFHRCAMEQVQIIFKDNFNGNER